MEPKEANEYVTPAEVCLTNVTHNLIGHLHCNATWDTITCWPPAMADKTIKQPCPYIFGAVADSHVYKTCSVDGKWAEPEMWSGFGYSDYSECIAHLSMIDEVFDIKGVEEMDENKASPSHSLQPIMIVAVTLLAISCLFLVIALVTIKYVLPQPVSQATLYSLTRHWFSSVLMDALLNTFLNVLTILEFKHGLHLDSISDSSVLCKLLIASIEFSNCAVHMWLFLQAFHIRLATLSGFLCTSEHLTYCLIGWGIPAIPTIIWVVTLSLSNHFRCWVGYKRMPVIWILDSSKILMILAAVGYLMASLKQQLQNSDLKRQNYCFRRICYETITCICYFIFLAVSIIFVLITDHGFLGETGHESLSSICKILVSCRGVVLASMFVMFNVDIKEHLQLKTRKIRHQHLDLVSTEDMREDSCVT